MEALVHEAQTRQLVIDQTEFFVEAFECGVYDCAIDVRLGTGMGTSQNREGTADILFEQFLDDRRKKVLDPLDVMCCTVG